MAMTKRGPRSMVCVECGKAYVHEGGPGGIPITCSKECQRKRRNKVIQAWRDTHECPPSKHGTLVGYVNFQCGCDECRAAASAYRQGRRRGEGPEEIEARIAAAVAKVREKRDAEEPVNE